MRKIAGIDVSRNKISVCVLDRIPDLKRGKKPTILEFKADAEGIANFLALEFDAAIMEPTGGHYSRIWAHHLEKAGRQIRWVGHWEVASYRESWKTFNKSDKLDAIAMACYGIERWDKDWLFINPEHGRLRELYLQLQSFNRIKNPIVNRLRQQLCHEWPEVSEREVARVWLRSTPPGLWNSIVGNWTEKWRKESQRSIGTGISSFSQGLARQLCELEVQEYQLELALVEELKKACYAPYLKVFEQYEIRDRTAVALLSVIFPIQKFLQPNGKPIIEKVTTRNGKTATRNRSLAAFKLSCGVGMVWHQSGSFEGWVPGGRADIRSALWRWCKTVIIMLPKSFSSRNINKAWTEPLLKLQAYYEKGSEQIVDGELKRFDPGIRNQRVMRVARRLLGMLFKDLTREVF